MQNRLEMLRIYCAAAEASSFKEAAMRLGISPQAVTRAVREAEKLLGEVLFHRNTRHVRVTRAGEVFADKARTLVQQLDDLLRENEPQDDADISGLVRMTAPKSMGERFLMPTLLRLAEQYPRVTIDVRLSDVIIDPIAEQIDIGVRIGFMRDSRFVVRQASSVGFLLVATPKMLARTGVPTDMAGFAGLPATGFLDRSTGRLWPWQLADGQQFTPSEPRFQSDDAEVELRAVLAGIGFAQIVSYLARPHIRSGALVAVLDELAPDPWPVYVYRPQRGPVPARIRLVFDAVVGALEAADLQ
jgi:DNA-binding transcriptional LysR family regulator